MPKPSETPADQDALIEDMGAAHSDVEFDTSSLAFDLRDALIETIKRMPQPWGQTPEGGQRDIAAALEHTSRDIVRRVVELVRSNGESSIRALLVGYTEKDGGVQATLKIKTFEAEESAAAILGLHRAVGKHVLMMVASAEDFARDRHNPNVNPDAPGLDFESGSDAAQGDAENGWAGANDADAQ